MALDGITIANIRSEVNAAITGVNGGLVVLAADDPSMHSSQNEQDSRFYAKFAMIPCVEPSNQQEAYDLTRYAFDLSEQLHEPVLLRVTTRMAHSRAVVQTAEVRAQNDMSFPHNVQHLSNSDNPHHHRFRHEAAREQGIFLPVHKYLSADIQRQSPDQS